MTKTEKSPDIATLNAQVADYLPEDVAARISGLPQDDLQTLSEAYIALVALDGSAPADLVAEIDSRLRATENLAPGDEDVPHVVTY